MSTERFAYDVDPGTGCWVWSGYRDRNGYARIYVPKRSPRPFEWAHRYSYEVHNGPLLAGHEIDHTCQNPPCVNPQHLDQVTRSEHIRRTMDRLGKSNLHAAAARLRMSGLTYAEIAEALDYAGKESAHFAVKSAIGKGLVSAEDVPRPNRLSQQEYEDIRLLHALGVPQTALAEFYSVNSSQVSRICNGRSSGHDKGAAA